MTYLWQEFNIKTFPAETIVYRDGVFDPSLSTIESGLIDQKYDLPIHIIYVGEISGDKNLEINVLVPDQDIFLTIKIKNKLPAFLNIYVKNTGEMSIIKGQILIQNYSVLNVIIKCHHLAEKTGILIKTKVVAHASSDTKLMGSTEIEQDCPDCESDIGFSALAAADARIEFSPAQFIRAAPIRAEHSASIYRGTPNQIEFLRETGLSGVEVTGVLEEAFMNDFLLFLKDHLLNK